MKGLVALGAALFALSLSGSAVRAADAAQMQANKKAVVAFYEAAINQKDFDAASKYLGPRYTQHNPNAADGPVGLKGFLAFLKDKFPNAKSEIKRAFADGDYVILHVHAVREPGTRGNAIIDIFKLENGKVVEHWDVTQPIPEKAANENGTFSSEAKPPRTALYRRARRGRLAPRRSGAGGGRGRAYARIPRQRRADAARDLGPVL